MHPTSGLAENFVGSVTVGERGQVVIPAAARERCGIDPSDKLLCFMQPEGAGVILLRVDALAQLSEQLKQIEALVEGGNGSPAEEGK